MNSPPPPHPPANSQKLGGGGGGSRGVSQCVATSLCVHLRREARREEPPCQKTDKCIASSHLELYRCSLNNSNGGHFAVSTIDALSLQRLPEELQSTNKLLYIQSNRWSGLCKQFCLPLHFCFPSSSSTTTSFLIDLFPAILGARATRCRWWRKSTNYDSHSRPSAR